MRQGSQGSLSNGGQNVPLAEPGSLNGAGKSETSEPPLCEVCGSPAWYANPDPNDFDRTVYHCKHHALRAIGGLTRPLRRLAAVAD